ncbi:AAA domain-containing protein [Terribacillus aidingensis]|uniref:AAA domain-containing protein n=1 Tax=Terribacillus aidingensis TaxID=586416 RepID=A0A285P2Q2_9BACI|nr:AAA domain-containing protein [Terribacillus aidingensis]
MKLDEMNQYVRQMSVKEKSLLPNHFPFTLPIIQKLGKLWFHPNVTYIIGENGMGKSTLLEALAVALGFNPEGGSKNFSFSSYASHSCLHEFMQIVRGSNRPRNGYFFRAETFYNSYTLMGNEILDTFDNVDPDELNESLGLTGNKPSESTSSNTNGDISSVDTNSNGQVTIKEAKAAGFSMPITRDHWLYPYMDDRDNDGMVGE